MGRRQRPPPPPPPEPVPPEKKPDDGKRKRQRERKAMGVETPRCGHPKWNGEPCKAFVVEGSTRCGKHGGKNTIDGGPIDPHTVTGVRSPGFQVLRREGNIRLAELERDPQLLSVKRPAALSTFLVEQMAIEPTDKQIETKAQTMAAAAGVEIDDTLRVLARNEIIAAVHQVVHRHATVIFAANKVLRVSELLIAEAMPIFAAFGEAMKKLAVHYIDDPVKLDAFMAALRDNIVVTIAKLGRVGMDD